MKKEDSEGDGMALSRAMRDMVLDADSSSLSHSLSELGINPLDIAELGRTAAARALQSSPVSSNPKVPEADAFDWSQLHEALSALVQLLRRRDKLSEEELAERARIDVSEIRRIECDTTYVPTPRTIYQLEQTFKLPRRTLVKLSGLTTVHSKEFTEEAVRFAAHSKAIQKITRDELNLLNEFVKFLSAYTDSSPKE